MGAILSLSFIQLGYFTLIRSTCCLRGAGLLWEIARLPSVFQTENPSNRFSFSHVMIDEAGQVAFHSYPGLSECSFAGLTFCCSSLLAAS